MKRIPVDLNDPQDVEDELEQVICDSFDVDWNARDGARAVQRWLDEHQFAIVKRRPPINWFSLWIICMCIAGFLAGLAEAMTISKQ